MPDQYLEHQDEEERTSIIKGGGTLSGNKSGVYKILKIMKLCTNAPIESFKMKYAMDRCLEGKKYEKADIGSSLKRVLRYWTLRGKFDGVHPDLGKAGIKSIKPGKSGLIFDGL